MAKTIEELNQLIESFDNEFAVMLEKSEYKDTGSEIKRIISKYLSMLSLEDIEYFSTHTKLWQGKILSDI